MFGDRANHLALVTDGTKVQVWNQQRGQRTMIAQTPATATAGTGSVIRLRIACTEGSTFRFAVQGSGGVWTELAGQTDGSSLPPWDRACARGFM